MSHDKRDFREETALNASEEALLIMLSGQHGLNKSAIAENRGNGALAK